MGWLLLIAIILIALGCALVIIIGTREIGYGEPPEADKHH